MPIHHALRDHRFYARMPLPLEVELSVAQSRLGRFEVRDIDLGGLFVESRGVDLYPNDVVDVGLVQKGDEVVSRKFRARVVRHAPHGIGLMFLDYDQASLGALMDVMVTAQDRLSGERI
jgi:hypothetical protein